MPNLTPDTQPSLACSIGCIREPPAHMHTSEYGAYLLMCPLHNNISVRLLSLSTRNSSLRISVAFALHAVPSLLHCPC